MCALYIHPARPIGIGVAKPDELEPGSTECGAERRFRVAAMVTELRVQRTVGGLELRDENTTRPPGTSICLNAFSAPTSSAMCSSTLTQSTESNRWLASSAASHSSKWQTRKREPRMRGRSLPECGSRNSGSARSRRHVRHVQPGARSWCRCRTRPRAPETRGTLAPAQTRGPIPPGLLHRLQVVGGIAVLCLAVSAVGVRSVLHAFLHGTITNCQLPTPKAQLTIPKGQLPTLKGPTPKPESPEPTNPRTRNLNTWNSALSPYDCPSCRRNPLRRRFPRSRLTASPGERPRRAATRP